MLQRVSFPVAGTEVVGILHLPDGAAVGGVAVLPGRSDDVEAPHVVLVCDTLARAGVGAMRFGYHEPEPTVDGALADAAAAVRLLKAHPALPERVGVVGFGFGAAVAAIGAGRDSRIRVAVLAAPPAEIGGSRRPLAEVTRTRARVLLLRGSRDAEIAATEVERYSAVLSQARVTHRVLTIDGAGHDFGPAGPRARAAAEIADWVRESF